MPARALLPLILGLAALAIPLRAAEPADLSQITILDVLQHGDTILASSNSGLYEATQTEKVWHKIPTPAAMPPGGNLAQESPTSPRLAYFTGQGFDFMMPGAGDKPSLFLSPDTGKTWTRLTIEGDILDAFLHPDGSIYAVTMTTTTKPFPPGGNSISRTDAKGVAQYPSVHLKVSRDKGKTWADITPQVHAAFGLWGILRDPDHPDLVCARSNQIGHISRTLIYQAKNRDYFWDEYHAEDWRNGTLLQQNYAWRISGGGANNADMPANLVNFFRYPYEHSGRYPSLPTKYLVTDQPSYHFHLHQPMPVTVTTFFMFDDAAITWLDNKNEQVFWSIHLQSDAAGEISAEPLTAELNTAYPDHDTKLAAYWHDPNLTTTTVDRQHAYQRIVDLQKLCPLPQPGHYRLQLTHNDQLLDRTKGSLLSTDAIDVTVDP